MAFTQSQIDQFEQNLVDRQGVVQTTFDDQSMTFTSYEDAMKFLAYMKRNLAGGITARYVATDKDV